MKSNPNIYLEVGAGRMTPARALDHLDERERLAQLERERRRVSGWIAAIFLGAALIIAGRAFAFVPAEASPAAELVDGGRPSSVATLPAADVPDDLKPEAPAAVDGAGDVKLQDDGSQLALLALQFAAAGMWGPFAAIALAFLIWAVRKWGKALFPKGAVFFDQPIIAAALPTVAAIAVDVALALKAGTPLSVALFMRSIGLGLAANGAFNVAMKLREQRAIAAGTKAAGTVTDRKSAADALNGD